jgi:hypothetical protein
MKASLGWWWLPGMKATNGALFVGYEVVDGQPTGGMYWCNPPEEGADTWQGWPAHVVGFTPDFSDPCTLGGLWFLVREALPERIEGWPVEVQRDRKDLCCVVRPYHDPGGALRYEVIACGRDEAEALVRALEAAS